jgi:hypothetical protein
MGFLSVHYHIQTVSGAHPVSCPVGTGVLILGVKQQGVKLTSHLRLVLTLGICGATPPLPNKTSWSCASSSKRYVFMAWCLVKHKDNFTLPSPTKNNMNC